MLSCLSFVDTPGVLSGDKQRVGRSYDFEGGEISRAVGGCGESEIPGCPTTRARQLIVHV